MTNLTPRPEAPSLPPLSQLPSATQPLPHFADQAWVSWLSSLRLGALATGQSLSEITLDRVAQTEANLPRLAATLTPADPREVAFWVEFLRSRYRARGDDPRFATIDARLWLWSLKDWPLDVLQAAVVRWMDEARPYPPSTPGEVKALGAPIFGARSRLLSAAETVLEAARKHRPHMVVEPDPRAVSLLARLGIGGRG